jgi:hypothetical protein
VVYLAKSTVVADYSPSPFIAPQKQRDKSRAFVRRSASLPPIQLDSVELACV